MTEEKRQKQHPNLRAGAAAEEHPAGEPAPPPKPKQTKFVKGQSGNPAGRRKGKPTAKTVAIREMWRDILEDPQVRERLLYDARRGKLAPPVLCMGFAYAYGKPKENVDVRVIEALRVIITDDIGEEPTSAPALPPAIEGDVIEVEA